MKENSTGLSAATQGILYALGAYGIWGGGHRYITNI